MTRLAIFVCSFLFLFSSQGLQAKVKVFACEPEWQALAEAIGGEYVTVSSATTAFQDPHHIEARPSLIAKARRADLIMCTGAELEIGWLPLLLRQSGNKAIQQDQPGYLMAAEQVERLEVLEKVDRSMGDVHASGNPHVHLDPYRVLDIAEVLTDRLQHIDAQQAEFYRTQFDTFESQWQAAIQRWEQQSIPLKGKRVIVYHKNWSYLLNWLGMEMVADLEPKPGIPPTSRHLASLLSRIKTDNPHFIVTANYQDQKGANWIAKKSGLAVVELPFTVGGNKDATDLVGLYDSIITTLLKAVDNTTN